MVENLAYRNQIWVNRKSKDSPPDPDKVQSVSPNGGPAGKPGGGFWTSPVRNRSENCVDAGWINWASTPTPVETAWILKPERSLNVFTIDSKKDVLQLPTRDNSRRADVDWRFIVKNNYDCILVTRKAATEARLTERGKPDLNSWDCESIFWTRWAFTDVEKITNVRSL